MCWFYVPTCGIIAPTSPETCYNLKTFTEITSQIASDSFGAEVGLLLDLYETRGNVSDADPKYSTVFKRTENSVLNEILDIVGQNETCPYKGAHNAACETFEGNDEDCQTSVFHWLVNDNLAGHDQQDCKTHDCFERFKRLVDAVVDFYLACRPTPQGLEEGLEYLKVRNGEKRRRR
jgi:hypothetical protein